MKEVSIPEFFELFDASVHAEILNRVSSYQATHLVCYEVQALDSSCLGDRTAMVAGGQASSTFEEASTGRLGDVPSRFQYPTYYAVLNGDIKAEAKKASNWGKPAPVPSEKRKSIGRRTDMSLRPSDEDIKKLNILKSYYEENERTGATTVCRSCTLHMDKRVYAALRITLAETAKDNDYSGYVVIGAIPKHTRVKVVYLIEGENLEWHLSWFFDQDEPNLFNPVGKTFSLRPWSKIDDGERTIRPAIDVSVTYDR